MKKQIIIVFVLFIIMIVCARLTATAQHINGTFENDRFNNKTVVIKTYDFEKKGFKTIDSTVIRNQKFTFNDQISPAQSVYVFVEEKGKSTWGTQLVGGEGNATVATNAKGTIRIGGTPSNIKLQQFQDEISPLQQKIYRLYDDLDKPGIDDKSRSRIADSLQNIEVGYLNRMRLLTLNFVTKNMDNAAGQSKLETIMSLPGTLLEGLLMDLDSKHLAVPAVYALSEKVNAPKRIRNGQVAQDFKLKDLEGRISQIKDIMPKGKTVLIDFWASWCVPCLKSMPHLKELQAKYKDKGFEIIGISTDSKEDAWKKKVAELQLPWAQYLDAFEEGGNKYVVNAIPYAVLINPEGRIIATNLRGEDVDERLKRIFENK